jgi:hypothetical protein
MSKHITIFLFSFLTGISIQAQRHYLNFDYSIFQFKHSQTDNYSNGLSKRLNRCEGSYEGASFHFAARRNNSIGIGMGLSNITYQKEWLGTFPESNQFGFATVRGQIKYWSFPVSYTRIIGSGVKHRYRSCYRRRENFRFGFSITYIPSFEGKSSFTANTFGGANLDTFLSDFESNEQSFQHSLMLGLCNQFFLINKCMKIDLEPYLGIGSGYFKEYGTNINNLTYGLRLRIGFSVRLPTISIQREVDSGNAAEKKKQLEQKQKEIQEQLNKNPK